MKENKKAFQDALTKFRLSNRQKGLQKVSVGKGMVLVGENLTELLLSAAVRQESLVQEGIHYLRKKTADGSTQYFLVNGDKPFSGWIKLRSPGARAVLHDPMTGMIGSVSTRITGTELEIFLQLKARESIFVTTYSQKTNSDIFNFYAPAETSLLLQGPWKIEFVSGGPVLPPPVNSTSLNWWTTLESPSYKTFSGCAVYTTTFKKTKQRSSTWLLDLGEVKESAEVFVNGKSLGVLLGPTFQVVINDADLTEENKIEIQVCNLMANRISYLDQQGVFWKKFYNVNFPARKVENRKNGIFDAAHWPTRSSGLKGPVSITAASRSVRDR